jgi:outer membrane protein TolC
MTCRFLEALGRTLYRFRRRSASMMETRLWYLLPVALAACGLWSGCGPDHYHQSADNEVYGILKQRSAETFGKTNDTFTINTAYSGRKPTDIPPVEIIQQRLLAPKRKITLSEALKTAIALSPSYQTQKETVYSSALALTAQRHTFAPVWASTSRTVFTRNSAGRDDIVVQNNLSVTQTLKSGGQVAISTVNDYINYFSTFPPGASASVPYYNGAPPHSTAAFVANFAQPLMRNAGYKIATENLTQAERNVIYALRTFARYEQTFAVNIATSYFQLLQQRDVIRNDYSTYKNLKLVRERAEALGVDRMSAFQVNQVRLQELSAMSTYISDVLSYQNSLDNFKITLGLPVGTDLALDESPMEELRQRSLPTIRLTQDQGHRVAIQHRQDLLNTVDQFEDTKRKIDVAIDQLKANLNLIGSVALPQANGYDYSRFDVRQYQAYGGFQLDLPLDRLNERNSFRTSQINFEAQLRTLQTQLDTIRNSIQADLRVLDTARKNFAIQQEAVRLAQSNVDGAVLLMQANRIDMLNLLNAQSTLLSDQNSFEQALVSYHVARWNLLSDLGIIRIDLDRFWVAEQPIPLPGGSNAPAAQAQAAPQSTIVELIPPDLLFQQ